jgi:hypothetical protein
MRASVAGVATVTTALVWRCCSAGALGGQVFAAVSSPIRDGGSSTNNNQLLAISADASTSTCGAGTVGLIDPAVGEWNSSSCIAVDWADDAETASVLADGTVAVYVTPEDQTDTFLARVDFATGNVTRVTVGGNQGNLRCTRAGKCYGISNDPTTLMEVDAATGSSRNVLALRRYEGFTEDASVIDPDHGWYHAILVGRPHNSTGGPSDQYLVTVDLTADDEHFKIIAEQPVGRDLMGPFAFSRRLGLLTFGSDRFADGLVALDYETGDQALVSDPRDEAGFGGVPLFGGAAFRADGGVYVRSVFPHPPRFLGTNTSTGTPVTVVANRTWASNIVALAAQWE